MQQLNSSYGAHGDPPRRFYVHRSAITSDPEANARALLTVIKACIDAGGGEVIVAPGIYAGDTIVANPIVTLKGMHLG